MNLAKIACVFASIFYISSIYAQENNSFLMQEIVIDDHYLPANSSSLQKSVVNDSIIKHHQGSFSDLLRSHSLIYLKENGYGMVSSPSLRGTSAQQTAVIWNGININSGFTGQTDFNLIQPQLYQNIAIESNGNSVHYNSGAIGGSIHLQNGISYVPSNQHLLQLRAGSFSTYGGLYQYQWSTKNKYAVKLTVQHQQSDNDYKYYNSNLKNSNGEFAHKSLQINFGYNHSQNSEWQFFSETSVSDRNLSGTRTHVSFANYKDNNFRNLLQWHYRLGQVNSNWKWAWIREDYTFTENTSINIEVPSSRLDRYVFKQVNSFAPIEKLKTETIIDMEYQKGNGINIGKSDRFLGSFGGSFRYNFTNAISADGGLRKEFSSIKDSPLLYNLGIHWRPVRAFEITVNTSKNYRLPTFNDLFWYAGGNTDLQPETAIQYNLYSAYSFSKKSKIKLGFYRIEIENMLRWVPSNNTLWLPENTHEVETQGIEIAYTNKLFHGAHQWQFDISATYGSSKNKLTDKLLIYSPKTRIQAIFTWECLNKWQFNVQSSYTDKAYTSSDNAYFLQDFNTFNSGILYKNKLNTNSFYFIKLQLINALNKEYMNVANRPMPGRHFQISTQITF